MNKLKAVWQQRKDVILFCLIACLYSMGGGGWLFLRRYAMPAVIVLGLGRNWKTALLSFICLSFPLHLGYTEIVDANNWPMIAGLGAIYGLSWLPAAKLRVIGIILLFAAVWPLAVYLCHFLGVNWQWAELIIGFGFGISYLIAGLTTKES